MKDNSLFPQVEQLINEESISYWIPLLSRPIVIQTIRNIIDEERNLWKETKKSIN